MFGWCKLITWIDLAAIGVLCYVFGYLQASVKYMKFHYIMILLGLEKWE